MRLLALPQAEVACQVAHQERLLLDVGQQGLVHALLSLRPLGADLLLLRLLTLLEEGLLTLLLSAPVTSEELIRRSLLYRGAINAGKVDLGGCGDDVAGVDSAEGNTVDLEGAGNEEDALGEGLEEDHTLATVAAGEEDQDGTRLERCARLVGALGLAGLKE